MSQQVWNNGAAYLEQRTKLNEMTSEIFQQETGGRTIYLDSAFNHPAGTTPNGSQMSPFNLLLDALDAVQTPASGGNIVIGIGGYNHPNLDIQSGVSFLNMHMRDHVHFQDTITNVNTNSLFQKIRFAGTPTSQLLFIGNRDESSVENVVFDGCNFHRITRFDGGTTGNDQFVYLDCIWATDTAHTMSGGTHIMDSGYVAAETQAFDVGRNIATGQPSTFCKITNSVFDGLLRIRAETGKTTTVVSFTTEINVAIEFDIQAGGLVLFRMDEITYHSALVAGTVFEGVEGLIIDVIGHTPYYFTETIINDTIDNVEPVEIITLTTPPIQNGLYEIKISFTWALADSNDAFLFDFHTDGQPISALYQLEPSDGANVEGWSYNFPIEITNNSFNLTMMGVTTSPSNTVSILAANIILEKKESNG